MKGSHAIFTSRSEEWGTPQILFDRLFLEFGGFDLDPCATLENAKCERYFTKEHDGLNQAWFGKVFMNPPYGKQIGLWMQKAYEFSLAGGLAVCLVHARTDTRWWHDWVEGKGKYRFLKGRLKFDGGKYSAPFPSAIVIYDGRVRLT